MGWLVGYTLGSMAAAFVVVRIFDAVVSEVSSTATDAARGTVFITTWTGVTARSGMRGVTKSAQKLRLRNSATKKKLESVSKDRD